MPLASRGQGLPSTSTCAVLKVERGHFWLLVSEPSERGKQFCPMPVAHAHAPGPSTITEAILQPKFNPSLVPACRASAAAGWTTHSPSPKPTPPACQSFSVGASNRYQTSAAAPSNIRPLDQSIFSFPKSRPYHPRTLKPSVKMRCASLNSGVEKDSRGSSFLRMSSSCAQGKTDRRVRSRSVGTTKTCATARDLARLLDVLAHLLEQRLGILVVGVGALLKLFLRTETAARVRTG